MAARSTDSAPVTAESASEPTAKDRPRARKSAQVWIATAGGVGFAPIAPGTWGSLVGLLLFFPLSHLGLPVYLLTAVALGFLGVWASDGAEADFGAKDDGRIVIDEVVGLLLALTPLVGLRAVDLAAAQAATEGVSWLQEMWGGAIFSGLAVTGFVLFRVFDIAKPGPVTWAERRFAGGMGVMMDDVVAGAFAAVALTPFAYTALLHHVAVRVETGSSLAALGWLL